MCFRITIEIRYCYHSLFSLHSCRLHGSSTSTKINFTVVRFFPSSISFRTLILFIPIFIPSLLHALLSLKIRLLSYHLQVLSMHVLGNRLRQPVAAHKQPPPFLAQSFHFLAPSYHFLCLLFKSRMLQNICSLLKFLFVRFMSSDVAKTADTGDYIRL